RPGRSPSRIYVSGHYDTVARQADGGFDRERWDNPAPGANVIVGNVEGGDGVVDGRTVRVFAEGPEDSPSHRLARLARRWAAVYVPGHEVRPISREDRFGRGGDHTVFDQRGFAGVRRERRRTVWCGGTVEQGRGS